MRFTQKRTGVQGYVLFDVLLAVFLFSLGFAGIFSLTETALTEARKAADLLEGANLAQSTLDSLTAQGWRENIASGACVPGGAVSKQEGKFRCQIWTAWDEVPQLLKVGVDVIWLEQGNPVYFKLEGRYAVDEGS